MFAIVALIVVGLWASLGYWLWQRLIATGVKSQKSKLVLTMFLAIIWFIGPVLDEIIGACEFEKLCREMPSDRFYGPIAVGSGAFFDEQGRPRWRNGDEFSAIRRKTSVWEKELFDIYDESKLIRQWPMPIIEKHVLYLSRVSKKPVIETFARYSKGGWLRRLIGIGDYQCPGRGQLPKSEDWIIFKPR